MKFDAASLILRLLREEFKYDWESVPDKGVHKLLYLVGEEAREEGLDIEVPYFWFQFGVLTAAEPGSGDGSPLASENDQDTHVDPELEQQLRQVVNRVLPLYYSSLEEVVDTTYEDAPYEVQRSWRKLDKKLQTHHPEYNDFYEVNPSRESIQDSIYATYDAFPTESYPQFEPDLNTWYSTMTRELNRPEFDAVELFDINILFWRIFALQLAEGYHYGLTKSEVREILEIDSFDEARAAARGALKRKESDALTERFEDDTQIATPDTRAADAFAEALVRKHTRIQGD